MPTHRTDRRAAAAGLLVAALLSFGLVAPAMAAGAAPTVDGTSPADGEANVALDAAIAVFFSETVNVADGWFTLVCTTSGTHSATVIPSGAGFVFLPDQAFVPNESCTFTVIAAFVSDREDPPTAMAADYAFSFTTIQTGVPDDAPTVVGSSPVDGAVDVALSSNVSITFSEPVAVAGAWFSIVCDKSGTHGAGVSGGPTVYTLNPSADFVPGESCTVTIDAHQVSDEDTNDPPDTMASDAVITFTTVAPPDQAPTVTSTTPADGAADVAVGSNLSVTFSEPVDVAGSWFELACDTSGAHHAAVSGGPTTFTLDPTTPFAAGEGCSLTILASHVTDQDTNDPPNAMANDVIASFTTVAPPDEAPTVASTTPSDGAGDVQPNANLQVTFSEPVAVAGTWFTISCDSSGPHAASVSGGPTTFVLHPTVDLAENESCMATIVARNVTDLDTADPPDAMTADFSFTFTTADLNRPPTVDAGGPYAVVEGGSVTITATGADPDGDPLLYAWDLDGNGTFETPGASFAFSAAGIQAPATRTFHVQVSDPDGATGTASATVKVVWAFSGFRPPLNGDGGTNSATAGSTIPVKFSLHGDQGPAIFRPGYPASASYDCGSVPPADASSPVTPGEALGYSRGNDTYSFGWKTDKSWAGTCRVLFLGLRDGTIQTLAIQFAKGTEQPAQPARGKK